MRIGIFLDIDTIPHAKNAVGFEPFLWSKEAQPRLIDNRGIRKPGLSN